MQCVTSDNFSSNVPISISCQETQSLLAKNFAILRCDLKSNSANTFEFMTNEIKIEPKAANAVVADVDRTVQLISQHIQKLEKDGNTSDLAAFVGATAGLSLKGEGGKGDLYIAALLTAVVGIKLILFTELCDRLLCPLGFFLTHFSRKVFLVSQLVSGFVGLNT